ncbi:MAG TPA: hypothetical protein VJN96_00225 [Vicinamibacterales bacterium]|nr:hypothetical protein [Vicinamibacterales bacterium]
MTRDKRGYESTLVMHAYRATNGGQRGRVLYLFRSPSNVHLGRRALDTEVMEALEHTHPDLNFDWQALVRDPALRSSTSDEDSRPAPRRQHARPQSQAAPSAPPVVIVEDDSLLGKTLGADHARRLRQQFAELLQRIARRARTPDDRDRLTERAGRLNPDGWADEAAIKAAVVTVEADWGAISMELPRRRRGRRGGRHASEARGNAPVAAPSAGPSGIIEESGDGDGAETDSVDREADARDDRGDDDRLGADAEARADLSDAADADGPAGNDLPGDGE